jgi:hypothetical protein
MKLTGGTDGQRNLCRFCRLSGLEQIVAVGKNQLAFATHPEKIWQFLRSPLCVGGGFTTVQPKAEGQD